MPSVGIRFAGSTYTWDEAMEVSEAGTIPFPPPMIAYLRDSRDDQEPSASVITGCLRRFELKRKVNYFIDVNKNIAPMMGTAFHDLMDKYRKTILQPGDLAEQHLTTTVEVPHPKGHRVKFAGRMDFMRPGALLSDWKTKGYIPQNFTPPREHVRQVNIYNWLAAANGYAPAKTWELVYVSWSWLERRTGAMYPLQVVDDFVRKQLYIWAAASSAGKLPEPVPEIFAEPDAKGKLPAPCGYCEVREQCLAALQAAAPKPF